MARSTPRVQDGVLRLADGDRVVSLRVGEPAWFAWLADAAAFAYVGPEGSFTARREAVGHGRGGRYWKAYRQRAGRLHRAYLGRSEDLTPARLEATAAALAARADGAPASSAGPAPAPLGPPPRPMAAALPQALTSFVGRERDLAEARQQLGQTRLLTLTGAGGVGKSRLALELARAVEGDYPDGAWLVELAPLADAALVPQAVASQLGVREQPGRPVVESLAARLRGKRLLLALDNAEYLVDAVARLAEALLAGCSGLIVLATSREPLAVPAEVAWRVPSLAVPDPGAVASPDALAAVAAVALFLDRARAARPDFALTAANAAAVAEVCRRLDGIPLAIELAAARIRALSVEQIAGRLDDRFRLLTGGSRTAPPRQQTLRAAVDWSHDLLSAPERALLRRLSVFAGGFALEAVEAACPGEAVAAADVLDLLARLVNRSLVQAEERDGAARYRLLETVRQYAAERLEEAGEGPATRDRHRDWCLALAERAEPALFGAEQLAALKLLDAEHDNLRAALAWCAERDPEAGLRLSGCLWQFWRLRGHFAEGRRWLEGALARAPAPTAARARALHGAGMLAWAHGYPADARPLLAASLDLSRALGPARYAIWTLTELGFNLAVFGGDLTRGRALAEEALARGRAGGDRHALGQALEFLGGLAVWSGDFRPARPLLEEALPMARAVGDRMLLGFALRDLGALALRTGEYGRAEALAREGLALAREFDSPLSVALFQWQLGEAAFWRGDPDRAIAAYEAGLAVARAAGDRLELGILLRGLGQATHRRGDLDRAAAVLEECLAVFNDADYARSSSRLLALTRRGLVAWDQGDAAGATALLRASLAPRRAGDDGGAIAASLEGLAAVAAGTGRPARAARLLGAAAALREATGAPLPPVERPTQAATAAAARAALGDEAFATAWAAGRALPMDGAIAEALGDADASPAPPAPAARDPAGLTRREAEVLRLLAAGATDAAIAGALSISVNTVHKHVAAILAKTGAPNRTAAVAEALRRGLP